MIPFFRKLRKKMANDSKPLAYIKYAIGEIVLVVIGILIALQINNWNLEYIQAKELDGLMKSISSAIQSDVRYLKLIRAGREKMGEQATTVFNNYIDTPKAVYHFNDYSIIAHAFNDLSNNIYYQPNLTAFNALQNSIHIGKLHGTDIELLLNSFYSAAERLVTLEEDYNQSLKTDYQTWSNKFRNNNMSLFLNPWNHLGDEGAQELFEFIVNDNQTQLLLAHSFSELEMVDSYDQQILLGEKFIEMVEKGVVNFDTQTKIDFSGTFYSYSEVDLLNLLVSGKIPSGFELIYAQSSDKYYDGVTHEEDHIVLTYPENTFDWGSPYFAIRALKGRVTEMDFTQYKHITLEMKGAIGGEQFALMMKDKYDLPDGTESRVDITLTNIWKTYKIPIEQFATADKKIIGVPLGFVFVGDKEKTVHVRSIQFN